MCELCNNWTLIIRGSIVIGRPGLALGKALGELINNTINKSKILSHMHTAFNDFPLYPMKQTAKLLFPKMMMTLMAVSEFIKSQM